MHESEEKAGRKRELFGRFAQPSDSTVSFDDAKLKLVRGPEVCGEIEEEEEEERVSSGKKRYMQMNGSDAKKDACTVEQGWINGVAAQNKK